MDKSWSPIQITLPEWPISKLLELTSPTATWLVGGTVRDLILNRSLHDWDFVTREYGIQLAKMAANHFNGAFYVLDQSRETGRAVVHQPGSASPITLDFASLRAETLQHDLENRDFTINSMAMSFTGQLIDPLHCIEDLHRKIIRMTTPSCFQQDPVRLLRAIRQSHFLQYDIEMETYEAICQQTHLITTVSPERILSELCAMLSYPVTAPGIKELKTTRLLEHIIPELKLETHLRDTNKQGKDNLWVKTVQVLEVTDLILGLIENRQPRDYVPDNTSIVSGSRKFAETINPYLVPLRRYFDTAVNAGITHSTILRWAALLHTVPVEKIQYRLTALRMPKKTISTICKLIQNYPLISQLNLPISRKGIYRFYKQAEFAGPGTVIFALALKSSGSSEIDGEKSSGILTQNAVAILRAFFEEQAELLTPAPLLRGDDLIKLGVTPGPEVGRMLDRLLEAQVTGEVISPLSAVDFIKNQLASND